LRFFFFLFFASSGRPSLALRSLFAESFEPLRSSFFLTGVHGCCCHFRFCFPHSSQNRVTLQAGSLLVWSERTRCSVLVIMVLSNDIDLLHPPSELEKRKHKLKRLVQSPNSFFMDVKCQGCFTITTVFSHSQTVVLCGSCSTVLCQPTGGKARLTEGCSFRKKGE
jgi:small subunit ribosomal protein S27e